MLFLKVFIYLFMVSGAFKHPILLNSHAMGRIRLMNVRVIGGEILITLLPLRILGIELLFLYCLQEGTW